MSVILSRESDVCKEISFGSFVNMGHLYIGSGDWIKQGLV